MKIGTVDMNKIFSAYYKTKDAEARINEARNSAKQELDERMDTYKKNLDDINKLNDDIAKPALSADAKTARPRSATTRSRRPRTSSRRSPNSADPGEAAPGAGGADAQRDRR